jgi:hypothetical protein
VLVLFRRIHARKFKDPLVADVRRCLVLLQLDGQALDFDLSVSDQDRDAAGERLVTEITGGGDAWVDDSEALFARHGVKIASVRRL